MILLRYIQKKPNIYTMDTHVYYLIFNLHDTVTGWCKYRFLCAAHVVTLDINSTPFHCQMFDNISGQCLSFALLLFL